MSILTRWGKAIETLNEEEMNACLHDDYKFTLHSAGKILTKEEVIKWAMSGDIIRKNVRILFENDEVGVEHAFVSFLMEILKQFLHFLHIKMDKFIQQKQEHLTYPKMIRKISIISFIGFLLLYYIVMITDISAFMASPEIL